MELHGEYNQQYTIDRVSKELVVKVELKQRQGMGKPSQNLWYGVATANGQDIKHPDLPYCVNAEAMAETIALEIIEEWKKKANKQGNSFRLKRK